MTDDAHDTCNIILVPDFPLYWHCFPLQRSDLSADCIIRLRQLLQTGAKLIHKAKSIRLISCSDVNRSKPLHKTRKGPSNSVSVLCKVLKPEETVLVKDAPTCKVCLEGHSFAHGRLVSPCACRGTAKYIHENCLKQWHTSLGKRATLHCPTCQQPYYGEVAVQLAQLSLARAKNMEPMVFPTDLGDMHSKENVSKKLEVAKAMSCLATLLKSQGRYKEAKPMYEEALQIDLLLLGNEHPNVATDLNNLALLLTEEGKFCLAAPLFEQALAIYKSAFGESHPHVATALNNLASFKSDQGRFLEAEQLYRQSYKIDLVHYGPKHTEVATDINNLADLLTSRGRYKEAEALYLEALDIYEQVHGSDHPYAAVALNNLAVLYSTTGRHEEEEVIYPRILSIQMKMCGRNHPDVARTLNNRGGMYQAQGKFHHAEREFLSALEIRLKLLGPDPHPDIGTSLNNLAALMLLMGRFSDAEHYYRRALSERLSALREGHPDVADTLESLAGLAIRMQNKASAKRYRLALDEARKNADGSRLAISQILAGVPLPDRNAQLTSGPDTADTAQSPRVVPRSARSALWGTIKPLLSNMHIKPPTDSIQTMSTTAESARRASTSRPEVGTEE
ncbi:hypothetical protein CYMTET_48665 [Cymbomonas tetramitiformis]|uniref:Kinesin light chain n=1 Tax=Cymbomonas tetramitiformis TaxID=36881 RepID=A0AAE0BTK0_9CHLO|nr:hypothetical protein CYMTET_48665 [Cymbomonas tetramitiformis]